MVFRGDYYFLSNMYPAEIKFPNYTFKCAEAAFQAAKCANKNEIAWFQNADGFQARKLGRQVKLRLDWELVKRRYMYQIVVAKFKQHPELLVKLKCIEGDIEETNTWGDTFWGVCNGIGRNELGKILMEIRDGME